MTRSGPGRATVIETVPVMGCDARAVVALDLNAEGRVVGISVKATPPAVESADERAARELAEGIAHRLRRATSLAEAVRHAQAATAFLENLAALEDMHGPEARALLAPAGRG